MPALREKTIDHLATRLALVAILAATGPSLPGRRLCARLMDEAAGVIAEAPAADLAAAVEAPAVDRFRALGVLATACAACAACPRGRAMVEGPARFIDRPPPPWPDSPPRPPRRG